jgi:hypothetical protein
MKILYIYIYIYISLVFFCRAQNLVPNPSFEIYTLCPNSGSQIEYAMPWTAATSTSSTDYYNSCSVGVSGVPYNSGFQYPKTGNAYAGLIFYHTSGLREYLQVQLISPLIQNKTYYIEFFINLNSGIWNSSCNNIAANLSTIRPYTSAVNVLQQLTPHIMLINNPIITDTLNWIKVSGCYLAQGGEEYITIGNFFDNINTVVSGTTGISHYLIDDVLVEEMTGACVTVINELSTNFNIDVYPNPTIDNLKITISNLNNKEKLSVKIIDVIGKEVLNEPYQEELDISRLEQGIYFVSVYSDKQLLGTKKIIKQ